MPLQNVTAFFASTSLIALGGTVTLFHSTEDMLTIIAALPFGAAVTHVQWEMKVVGLMIIFTYAFFKFAWSYRLYNYGDHARRCTAGGRAGYARGEIARGGNGSDDHRRRPALQSRPARLLLALGYLGWFLGPLPLIATTAGVLVVMWRRQFASDSRAAVRGA